MRLKSCIVLLLAGVLAFPAGDYRAGIERWRVEREAKLKADGGWLTVAGLFWLKDGENRFGTGAGNAITLASGPAEAGLFELRTGQVTLRLKPGVAATLNGAAVHGSSTVRADSSGAADVVRLAGLSMQVIERGGRFGIRLKDPNSRFRKEFTGLKWFPVKESYRVTATLEPRKTPGGIRITNVLGQTTEMQGPGVAVFRLNGQQARLTPVDEDGRLFFIFRDATAGKQTYGAGRFLYADAPRNGKVVLDFNKAENPPCAFTSYATCPLPPRENRLLIPIEAGERTYHHSPAR